MIPFKSELLKLHLPIGKYAVFGSAILSVNNIRKSKDLDIIVKKELHDMVGTIGNITIYKDWFGMPINAMINSANMIEGIPFVSIKYWIQWKRMMGRPKDLADLKLLGKDSGIMV